jgi:hypothetical protein
MPNELSATEARQRAEALIGSAVRDELTDTGRIAVIDALTVDLLTADRQGPAEARLEKVETQTRVLSDAMVAIGDAAVDAAVNLAATVKAVKDEM